MQVGSATIRLNCSRWSIHHLFILLPSSLLTPTSVGPSPSPVPSLKTLRPRSFAWGHVIHHSSQRLSLVWSPPHGAKQKDLCVDALCMSANPSFQPRCKFWPIFTTLSHFCQDWGWEVGTRCFCWHSIFVWVQTLMAVREPIIQRWELCRQNFCFMSVWEQTSCVWYFLHTYVWCAWKSYANT